MLARQHHQIQNTAPPEPAAMYRDGFLQATGHLGITRDDAAALVESISGRPFDECGWAELEPAIHQLQVLVDVLSGAESVRRKGCG